MATYTIVYGHGNGDPGGSGNGTNERDFTRKELHPHLLKWANRSKHKIVFWDTTGNRDLYQDTARGWGVYGMTVKSVGSLTEIHLDAAANAAATGGHVIISSLYNPDNVDLGLALPIKRYVGWWGTVKNTRGINKRNNLLNCNVAAQRGIPYRLMELGFITNKKDLAAIRKNLDAMAKEIIESITGEKLSAGAQTGSGGQAANYYQTGSYFVALKDLQPRNKKWTKDDKTWFLPKGTKFAVREIVKSGSGSTHAQLAGLTDTYVTLAKSHVKPQ